jgi:hypothetical protein
MSNINMNFGIVYSFPNFYSAPLEVFHETYTPLHPNKFKQTDLI